MSDLRARPAGAALALKLAVLTVTRTSEVLNAKQGEFDLNAGLWTIPAARMEARREHRVALSKPALATVSELAKTRISEFVFPGQKLGRPLSNMAMLMLLEPMGRRRAITSHGFRSTFFGLGFGSQPVLVGASRKRSCAYDRQQSRGRIPPRRCPRKASGDDGGLGAMVRAERGERRGLRKGGWLRLEGGGCGHTVRKREQSRPVAIANRTRLV